MPSESDDKFSMPLLLTRFLPTSYFVVKSQPLTAVSQFEPQRRCC
jgi:hypothetical protein